MINRFLLKEGKGYVYSLFALFIFFLLIDCELLASFSFIIMVLFLIIFRNSLPKKAAVNALVSPISGKVYAIDKKDSSSTLYVDVCLFGNSNVISMKECNYNNGLLKNGLNLNAKTYKASLLNTKKLIDFDDIKLEFISGRFDIKSNFENSKKLNQYDQVGVFVDGIVKINIPNTYEISTNIGDKINIGNKI